MKLSIPPAESSTPTTTTISEEGMGYDYESAVLSLTSKHAGHVRVFQLEDWTEEGSGRVI